jgi:DNA-directed RNA polymerase II subunit RPB1
VQGVLLTGVLTKRVLGPTAMGLVHVTMNDAGPPAAAAFLDAVQRVVNRWLVGRGFSVGVSDAVIPDAAVQAVAQVVADATAGVARAHRGAAGGALLKQAGVGAREAFEGVADAMLNTARDAVRGTCAMKGGRGKRGGKGRGGRNWRWPCVQVCLPLSI